MIGRILRSADFERVLGTPIRARSAHFAVHYLASVPSRAAKPGVESPAAVGAGTSAKAAQGPDSTRSAGPSQAELSTGVSAACPPVVDESPPAGIWVGYVVPKRHARRAVTRTLLKRQIRHAVDVQAGPSPAAGLSPGLWVVRLRSPFDRKIYPSAHSEALRDAAAAELRAVMADAARRVAR